MKEINFIVSESEENMSVKDFLIFKGLSKTIIKKAKIGGIFVCGEQVTVRHILKKSNKVKVILPAPQKERIKPIKIPIKVVYEDDFLLIVDKPKNMPTHPSRCNSLPTLANAVSAIMGEDFVFRTINRLDRDTSGLVLIAKDAHTASRLSLQMRNREITKKYLAIVNGVPTERTGIIDAPIRRELEGSMKRIVAPDGKEALTRYEVLKILGDNALVEVTPLTGRTHQIRVHFSYIGHPLVGDFLYGERTEDGYYLRCHHLCFVHPITCKKIEIKI